MNTPELPPKPLHEALFGAATVEDPDLHRAEAWPIVDENGEPDEHLRLERAKLLRHWLGELSLSEEAWRAVTGVHTQELFLNHWGSEKTRDELFYRLEYRDIPETVRHETKHAIAHLLNRSVEEAMSYEKCKDPQTAEETIRSILFTVFNHACKAANFDRDLLKDRDLEVLIDAMIRLYKSASYPEARLRFLQLGEHLIKKANLQPVDEKRFCKVITCIKAQILYPPRTPGDDIAVGSSEPQS